MFNVEIEIYLVCNLTNARTDSLRDIHLYNMSIRCRHVDELIRCFYNGSYRTIGNSFIDDGVFKSRLRNGPYL